MPEQEKLRILFRMLITITREEEEKRLEEVLQSMHIPIFFQARGQGTAPSEILDLFGLGGTTRIITTAFVLNMVSKFLCSSNCKGLCASCGKNVNEGPCDCKPEPDPRLAVLGQLLKDKM